VLISIVIPTAGRPDLLARALSSLGRQRWSDWEALVVDDGDGRGALAASRSGDGRVRGIMNPGRGQVDARNAGIVVATGDVVCWLDDDDWLEDDGHLGEVARALRVAPALVPRSGWMVSVDDGGRETDRRVFDLEADAVSLRRDNTVLTTGLAYPRALHRELGLLDRAVDGYYDWDWHLRVVAAGVPLVRLPGLGVAYRVHAGNDSGRPAAARQRAFDAFRAKHGLDVVMKNHALVLEERAPRGLDPAPA
jgi:glycosyltransferase involved in cell wall biosynthesis